MTARRPRPRSTPGIVGASARRGAVVARLGGAVIVRLDAPHVETWRRHGDGSVLVGLLASGYLGDREARRA